MVDPAAFVEHFDRNFNEIKDEMYGQFPKQYTNFMRVIENNKSFYRSTYIGGLGMPIANRDAEPIPFRTPPKGSVGQFEPINYRLGYQIERTTIEQEEWGLLADRPRTMLYGASVLMDQVGANILNNGFTTQSYDHYIGATAKPLFSETHQMENNSGTWSNLIGQNLPITVETVFQVIVELLYNLNDSADLPIAYNGRYNLYVPSNSAALWQQAVEVCKSIMNPNSTDNKINAVTDAFQIVPQQLRFATNPLHWFVGWDVGSPGYGLFMFVNIYPETSSLKPFGNNEDVWWSRLRTRFVAGYENKRGIAAVGA